MEVDMTHKISQPERIVGLLMSNKPHWVDLPTLMRHSHAAQYGARIYELRREGYDIENRKEYDTKKSIWKSWFRLA